MQNLTRKTNEKVVIQTPLGLVVVTVCRIRRNQVSLGFEADRRILIDREEVYERKKVGAA